MGGLIAYWELSGSSHSSASPPISQLLIASGLALLFIGGLLLFATDSHRRLLKRLSEQKDETSE